jgi:hypothetical protein
VWKIHCGGLLILLEIVFVIKTDEIVVDCNYRTMTFCNFLCKGMYALGQLGYVAGPVDKQ